MAKNKIKFCFQVSMLSSYASSTLLVLRLIAGTAFILHGWGKIQSPLSWMPPEAGIPGLFQFLAAFSEFAGGIAWIIGLVTPLASLGMAITMAVAVYFHGVLKGDPFVGSGGASYELALIYLGISLIFIGVGPGEYSLDAKLFGAKK